MTRAEAIAHLAKAACGGQPSASQSLDVFRALGVLGYPAGHGVGDAPIRGERAWRLALKELPVRERSKAIYRVYRRVTGASSPWSCFPVQHRADSDATRIADEERGRRLERADRSRHGSEALDRASGLYQQDPSVREWLDAASTRTGVKDVYAGRRSAEPLERQQWLVARAFDRSRGAGLILPPFDLCWVTGQGGWAKCEDGGQRVSYSITLGVDVGTAHLIETAHHEARHLHDMHTGAWWRLTGSEREWNALSWAREMAALTPASEL
jgi:hypothetical protein